MQDLGSEFTGLTSEWDKDGPPRIKKGHYLLDLMLIISPKILEEGTLDPANNSISKCTTSVHILPLAFPCTLAMIRKVAMGVPPIASEFPDQDGA